MYPTVQYQIAKAHVADIHSQAQHGAQGRKLRAARKHQNGTPRVTVLAARRVFTVLSARA